MILTHTQGELHLNRDVNRFSLYVIRFDIIWEERGRESEGGSGSDWESYLIRTMCNHKGFMISVHTYIQNHTYILFIFIFSK